VHRAVALGDDAVEAGLVDGREVVGEHDRMREHGHRDDPPDGGVRVGDRLGRDLLGVPHLGDEVARGDGLPDLEVVRRDHDPALRSEGGRAPVQGREVAGDDARCRQGDDERRQPRQQDPR
jgi:hypothetical protein